jgi:predicted transcriptional regulator
LADVKTYETLQRRMSLLEGIARGEKVVEEGRTLPHAQAKKRMKRWLK